MAQVQIGIQIIALNKANAGLNQAANGIKKVNAAAKSALPTFRTLNFLMTGALTVGAIGLGKAFVKSAADMQGIIVRLSQVTGGFKNASATFDRLNTSFQSSGFSIGTVADGFTRIAAAGVDLEKTERLVNALGNSVAAFGGSSDVLDRAIIGFSQVAGKGTLQMEELRQQIGEAVPIALRLMAAEAGKSVPEFVKMVSKGMVSSDEAIRLFTEGAEKRFGGFKELLANTLSGSLGSITAAYQKGLKDIIEKTTIDERLTVIFQNVAKAVREFMAAIDEPKVEGFFEFLGKSADKAEQLFGAVQPLIPVIGAVGEKMVGIVNSLPADAQAFGIVGYAIGGKKGALIGAAIGPIFTQVLSFLDNLKIGGSNALSIATDAAGWGLLGKFLFGGKAGAIIAALSVINSLSKEITGQSFGEVLDESATGWGKAWNALTAPGGLFGRQDGALATVKGMPEKSMQDVLNQAIEASKAAGAGLRGNDDGKGLSWGEKIFGTKDQLSGVADGLSKLNKMAEDAQQLNLPIAGLGGGPDGPGGAAERIENQMASIRESVSDTIRTISDDFKTLGFDVVGDELGESIAKVDDKFAGFRDKLEDAIVKATKLNEKTGQEGESIAKLNDLLAASVSLRDKAVEREKVLYGLKQDQLALEYEAMQLSLQKQASDLDRQMNPVAGLFGGGGDLMMQVEDQRMQMMEAVNGYQQSINDLKTQELTLSGEQLVRNQQLQASYMSLAEKSKNAMAGLSAEGMATQQMWTGVSDILWNGVGDALYAVVTGTGDLKDIGVAVWNSLTKAAIDYLIQLLQIQAMKLFLGFADGDAFGGGITPFANGGAFGGGIQPFAKGGVVNGPTMFGVMGEAGPEAIMPLERIGGKLGVRATGQANGDNYTINVSAIDTQSGVGFVMKHMDTITAGQQQRQRLNRGMNRMQS